MRIVSIITALVLTLPLAIAPQTQAPQTLPICHLVRLPILCS